MQRGMIVRGQLRSSLMGINRPELLCSIFASCIIGRNLVTQLFPASVGRRLLMGHVAVLPVVGLRCGQMHCCNWRRCLYLFIQHAHGLIVHHIPV